jgi:hypothetical protein
MKTTEVNLIYSAEYLYSADMNIYSQYFGRPGLHCDP